MTKNRFAILMFVLLAITILVITQLPNWFFHPEGYCTGSYSAMVGCKGYNFWSGISGSDVAYAVTVPALVAGWWYHHNCHTHGCFGVAWHPDPVTGHPVCRLCHPHHSRGGGFKLVNHSHPEFHKMKEELFHATPIQPISIVNVFDPDPTNAASGGTGA